MRLRLDGSATRRTLALALAVGPLVAACGVSGAVVPVCEGTSTERRAAFAASDEAHGTEMPIAIECWRMLQPERVEVWFTPQVGSDCWQLSRLDRRESADAVSITLFGSPHSECVAGADPQLTQIDLQAPIDDRALLDASRR